MADIQNFEQIKLIVNKIRNLCKDKDFVLFSPHIELGEVNTDIELSSITFPCRNGERIKATNRSIIYKHFCEDKLKRDVLYSYDGWNELLNK